MDAADDETEGLIRKRGQWSPAGSRSLGPKDAGLAHYVPILQWLPSYTWQMFGGDVLCGITVGTMMVPQVMAYALLAHLPPELGLYGAIVPPLAYMVFGSSRHLSVGPVSIICVMLEIILRDSEDAVGDSIVLSFLCGVVLLLLWVFQLGFMENALSRPVLSGFVSAIALSVTIEQMDTLLGLPDLPRGSYLTKIGFLLSNMGDVHASTCSLSFSSIFLLIVFTDFSRRFPHVLVLKAGAFFVSVFGILVVWSQRLDEDGVEILGAIPNSFPQPSLPNLNGKAITRLLPGATTLVVIGFIESLSVAKVVALKRGYPLDADRELAGLGAANLLGSFFQAFPSYGALSRTPVMEMAGGTTQIASLVCSVVVASVAAFMMSGFYFLPKAVMAAIVVVAVCSLLEPMELVYLWRTNRFDFAIMLLTFLATFLVGIEEGITIALVLSVTIVIRSAMRPVYSLLNDKDASGEPKVVRIRFEQSLFFANITAAKAILMSEVAAVDGGAEGLVVDLAECAACDASALHMFEEVLADLDKDGVGLCFVRVNEPTRKAFANARIVDPQGGEAICFEGNQEANAYLAGRQQQS